MYTMYLRVSSDDCNSISACATVQPVAYLTSKRERSQFMYVLSFLLFLQRHDVEYKMTRSLFIQCAAKRLQSK